MEGLISGLLRQVFHISQDGERFDVLTAVVDRIPYPTLQGQSDRTLQGLNFEDGSEGISFAVFDSNSAAPDLWSARESSKDEETMTTKQHYTLSFSFPPTNIDSPPPTRTKESSQSFTWRCLQLPVANTIFQNGKIATLNAQQWRSQQAAGEITLSCIIEIPLPKQTLHMTEILSERHTEPVQSLDCRLMSITPTRPVLAAIGNIIRRLSVDAASGSGLPASEELEQQVADAIDHGRIPAQQPGIWALIKPKVYQTLATSVGNDKIVRYGDIQRAVFDGCHLRKVLSGGGGWGEKQGLLALDPDSGFGEDQESSELSFDANMDDESRVLQGLNDIVKPGDTVEFFVNEYSPYRESVPRPIPDQLATRTESVLSMIFGSLPSSMDAMHISLTGKSNKSLETNCTVINNHFGMLSEQGMSLRVSDFPVRSY